MNIISGVSCSFEVCLETRLDIMIEEPILVKWYIEMSWLLFLKSFYSILQPFNLAETEIGRQLEHH